MKYINRLVYLFALLIVVSGCTKFDESDTHNTIQNGDELQISFNFNPSFSNEDMMLTRSGATYRVATNAELKLDNVVTLAFTNFNPVRDLDGNITAADPKGELVMYAEMRPDPNGAFGKYIANVPKIEDTPVVCLGVANLRQTMVDAIKEAYETGESLTYERFMLESIMPIKYSEVDGLKQVIPTNDILYNRVDPTLDASGRISGTYTPGILPLSVDPFFLEEFTREAIDKYAIDSGKGASLTNSIFGYSRVDILLYEMQDENGQYVEGMPQHEREQTSLLEAYLCNITNVPSYTDAAVAHLEHIDVSQPTTSYFIDPANYSTHPLFSYQRQAWYPIHGEKLLDGATSIYEWDDIIQGLYLYPNLDAVEGAEDQYVSIIVKATTAQSELDANGDKIPEFFKVVIKYTENILDENGFVVGTRDSHLIKRNTVYRLKIYNFEGNGYSTLKEAYENPPSNVIYDIEIDGGKGNDFVITNGTSYMALSNTVVDLYGQEKNWSGRTFDGFTVYYNENKGDEAEGDSTGLTSDEWTNVTKRISSETAGLKVVNADQFSESFKIDSTFTIKLEVSDSFFAPTGTGTGSIAIRVGNLVERVNVIFHELADDALAINTYANDPRYTYAYLDYGEDITTDIASWIQFAGTTDLEYSAPAGAGVPIVLAELATGQRDNLNCPAFIYNNDLANAESVRLYVYQENLEPIDFSDKEFVAGYIGGSFASTDKLTLSNSYILNPGETTARRFYIPISSRIKEVWHKTTGYATEDQMREYTYVGNEFEMPENWDVKVLWYDSQRVYDGNFQIERAEPLTDSEGNVIEERFSIIVPAMSQNFGNILVGIVDKEGGTESDLLWAWSLWVTDYDPMAIARANAGSATGEAGVGTYIKGATSEHPNKFIPHTADNPMVEDDALHRYDGDLWDNVGSYNINLGRFMMDRALGAFDNTAIGHGSLYGEDNYGPTIVEPVSGSPLYQHSNPRPYPGIGAIKADGTKITSFPTFSEPTGLGYTTVIGGLRRPYGYCVGLVGSYSHWLDPSSPEGNVNVIWGDKSLKITSYRDKTPRNEADAQKRVTKSIFDPSPLGWMVPSKYTFNDFDTSPTSGAAGTNFNLDGRTEETSTARIYRDYATFYYVSVRSSNTGALILSKSSTSVAAGYYRTNETSETDPNGDQTLSLWYGNNYYITFGQAGKASGNPVRPITQATY